LKSNGTVVAWGANTGNNTNVDYGQCTVPANLSNVVQIAAGSLNSLAVAGNAPPGWRIPFSSAIYGTNGFSVALPTRNGRVYRLEYAISLTNQTWIAFPLQAGQGGTTTFSDPTPNASRRFYRITQW
jgi:hypothetical protein